MLKCHSFILPKMYIGILIQLERFIELTLSRNIVTVIWTQRGLLNYSCCFFQTKEDNIREKCAKDLSQYLERVCRSKGVAEESSTLLGVFRSPRVALTRILEGIIRSSRGSARSPTSPPDDLLQTFENRQ